VSVARRRGLAVEIGVLAALAVAFFAVAARIELFERIDAVLRGYELYHLDEMILTLLLAALVFSILSVRRWFELADRIEANDRTERELSRERDFSATVLDTVSSLVLVIDPEGRVLRFNRCCEAVSGFAAREVVGRPFWEILLPPGDVDHQRESFGRLVASGGASVDENPWRTRHGEERHIRWTNTPVLDAAGAVAYLVSTGLDVTEERRSRRELEATEQKLRGILDSIDDFVWSQRADTREMIFVSPSFERVYGIPADALLRNTRVWLETVHPDDRERVESFVPRLEATGRAAMEYRIVRPDGSVRWVHDKAWAVRDASGRLERFDGIARDITDQKSLEEQLRQSQKLEAVGLLAGGIAHDFNNLLTAIGGYAELLAARLTADRENRASAEAISRAAERAASLTRQLLAFGRKQVLQPKVFNPNRLIAEMEPLIRRLIGEDIDLSVEAAEDLGDVHADPGQLEQVLMNLVVNARDAMPRGGGLVIRTGNVEVDGGVPRDDRGLTEGSYVAVTVADSGEGMDDAVRSRVFEPFFTTKPMGKGSGLGLSTAYGIVRQSGGHIELRSTKGDGTTFRVLLPRYAGRRSAEPPAAAPRSFPVASETVLVVEDEPSVLDLAREFLEMEGYRVLAAGNGVEALGLLRRHRRDIAVLVTDVVMPQLGGLELVEAIAPEAPDLPVVFMSGYAEAVVRLEGALANGAAFVQKPFTSAVLCQAVREALTRVQGRR
jgi:PAS domain S-box-containing protein